ncbi:GNAT family N-acetyltransferase [Paracoccus sp. M683]|uniref:GNAT family N-acetyltransferase n=1 Tax=Paracoccus sp. M683 TaxID=2594268 RepID=UPI00117DA345|nr:GNAT family N-acetyltransferase [Paracoccus sp. M683]TRW97774.1 GNAT family N-acetyltransferase [Paracoccus sp. M683]
MRILRPQAHDDARPLRGLGLLTRHPGQLRLRGLGRRDAAQLAAHLLRLPPEDRRARFHGGMNDFAVNGYVNRIDWPHVYIFGAFVAGDLRAVAELVPLSGETAGEVAVSVEPQYQHAGLGKLLVLATMLAARRIGLARIVLAYLSRNTAMQALARDMGARTMTRGPVIEATITLPGPTTAKA